MAINFISEDIYVAKSGDKGRGVFTRSFLKPNVVIEIAPVIVMSAKDRAFIDQTLLHDYIFEWRGKETGMLYGIRLYSIIQSLL